MVVIDSNECNYIDMMYHIRPFNLFNFMCQAWVGFWFSVTLMISYVVYQ